MIPSYLKPLSTPVKWALRKSAEFRLNNLPLSLKQADRWEKRIRRIPSVFAGLDLERWIRLPGNLCMRCGIVDVIERSLRTTRTWDPGVLQCVKAYLREGGTFLDIGANIGFFTLHASRIVGDTGRVIAIEPSKRAAVKLLAHLLRNRTSNVITLTVGAGESAHLGVLNLVRDDNIGASSFRPIHGHEGVIGSEPALVVAMDDLLESLGIAPTMIKIDVEGNEFEVLKGLRRTLATHRPPLIVELNEVFLQQAGTSTAEVAAFLVRLGYSPQLIDHETGEIRPAQADDGLWGDVLFVESRG